MAGRHDSAAIPGLRLSPQMMWLATSVVFTAGLAAFVWDFACAGLPRRLAASRSGAAPIAATQPGVA